MYVILQTFSSYLLKEIISQDVITITNITNGKISGQKIQSAFKSLMKYWTTLTFVLCDWSTRNWLHESSNETCNARKPCINTLYRCLRDVQLLQFVSLLWSVSTASLKVKSASVSKSNKWMNQKPFLLVFLCQPSDWQILISGQVALSLGVQHDETSHFSWLTPLVPCKIVLYQSHLKNTLVLHTFPHNVRKQL